MKARPINPNDLKMSPREQRKRGVELIKEFRASGISDDDICKKLGIPLEMKDRFFEHIGLTSE